MLFLILLAWWAIGFLSLLGVFYIIHNREKSKLAKSDIVECLIVGWLGLIVLAGAIDYLLSSYDEK